MKLSKSVWEKDRRNLKQSEREKGSRWHAAASIFLGVGASLLLVACGGGSKSGADVLYKPWYDVYGYVCEGVKSPKPGCNFYADRNKIVADEDPYASSMVLRDGIWEYRSPYDSVSDPLRIFSGLAWMSPTGILYDEYGVALNSPDTSEEDSRDLVARAAEVNVSVVASAAAGLEERYALNSQTALRVARTLNDWSFVGRKRTRSEKDLAVFTRRLVGVSVEKIRPALKGAATGNRNEILKLNVEVANYWKTSPETSRAVLAKWYEAEVRAAQGGGGVTR